MSNYPKNQSVKMPRDPRITHRWPRFNVGQLCFTILLLGTLFTSLQFPGFCWFFVLTTTQLWRLVLTSLAPVVPSWRVSLFGAWVVLGMSVQCLAGPTEPDVLWNSFVFFFWVLSIPAGSFFLFDNREVWTDAQAFSLRLFFESFFLFPAWSLVILWIRVGTINGL